MIGSPERPSYASYLPPCYTGEAGSFFARFVALFETLMAGAEPAPLRQLESWVDLDAVPAVLASELSVAGDLRYDAANRRLVCSGPMSEPRRLELRALGEASGAIPDPVERDRYLALIELLASRSAGRTEELPGLERILDGVDRYSDPLRAPASRVIPGAEGIADDGYFDDDFLPYLASWVALTLRSRWPEAKRRRLIRSITPLYKKRGTLEGIRRFLRLFVDSPVAVREELGIQVGVRSTVAEDTTVGGLPHRFIVEIAYGRREAGDSTPRPFDFEFLRQVTANTREVLDLEKPAHTDYAAFYDFPGIVVGEYSTAGWDTLIWPHGEARPLT